MTSPFTDPTSAGYRPYRLTEANEIWNAYSERRQAIGHSAVIALTTADKCLLYSTWRNIQNWCESNCDEYINDTVAPTGDYDWTWFTVSSWRAAAGLHENGFRRVTSWDGSIPPIFSYGKIEPGDIDGYWIREDLIKALSALKWTGFRIDDASPGKGSIVTDVVDKAVRNGVGHDGPPSGSCANARSACASDFASDGWSSTGGSKAYEVLRTVWNHGGHPGWWTFGAQRIRSRCSITNVPAIADVPKSWEVWGAFGTGTIDDYLDLDGLGGDPVPDEYTLFPLLSGSALAADTDWTTPYIGDISTFPHDLDPSVTCPFPDPSASIYINEGAAIHDGYLWWLLKWQFTHAT